MFISLLSPLLFLAPEVHLREMEKLWTDDIIIESVWKKFMSKLLGEWNDLILWVRSRCVAGIRVLEPYVTVTYYPVSRDAYGQRQLSCCARRYSL
jgi:hypothetical protein